MSYATIETSLLATLRTHADFDSTNVLAGDASAIKRGVARAVRVLKRGHGQEKISLMLYKHVWGIAIDLWVPWKGSIAALETLLYTEGQKIIDTLHQYPYLNASAGVTEAEVTNADAPEPLGERKGRYRGQRYVLTVTEIVQPTRAE